MNRIEFACLCNDQTNMKVSEKINRDESSGRGWDANIARDQHPHVWPFLSWRSGHGNISMNFFCFCCFKKSSCQLMSKEFTVRTGKLRPRGLLMIGVLRITDHLVRKRTSRKRTSYYCLLSLCIVMQ